ncbi:ATP-binding domain-containing protein [Bacillus pseudomycoides]|uniref:ATP-binding domain-containing protein n=1 Tax=Bacillus pseudomycoides TaxID=64104 RepID=UPI001145B546|nr:ATP-binding domain-containing protein [Bacillus pseudomycoides]
MHNTKETYPNTLTVSNRNNIKGLEFPFVICVVDYSVNKNPTMRNTLYMTLTRSFISSYLLIGKIQNAELILTLEKGLDEINSSLQMTIPEPTQEEREHQERIIKQYNKPVQNQHDILTEVFDGLNVSKDMRPYFRDIVSQLRPNETNREKLRMFISTLLG